jgi:hypothetical protein
MWHRVSDLSVEQRHTIEALLGRGLREDEAVNIHPSRILEDAPVGPARQQAFREYLADLDHFADRARNVSDDELDALADEA